MTNLLEVGEAVDLGETDRVHMLRPARLTLHRGIGSQHLSQPPTVEQ